MFDRLSTLLPSSQPRYLRDLDKMTAPVFILILDVWGCLTNKQPFPLPVFEGDWPIDRPIYDHVSSEHFLIKRMYSPPPLSLSLSFSIYLSIYISNYPSIYLLSSLSLSLSTSLSLPIYSSPLKEITFILMRITFPHTKTTKPLCLSSLATPPLRIPLDNTPPAHPIPPF